ncbi:MAG: twin-arginine translocation signal domain-containing protein, partial [Bacteroidales bacterium]|nr:twin-arginine translocation signal domain-containing protein [Bacteroidales bacterium]
MKRREFIRVTGAAAAATGLIPSYAYGYYPRMLKVEE